MSKLEKGFLMNTFLKVFVDVTQICSPTHQFMGPYIVPNTKPQNPL